MWVGWSHWRYRKEETISLLEAAILKTTGAEPLQKTRLDRFLTYIHAVLDFAFGALFLLVGIFVALDELGAL